MRGSPSKHVQHAVCMCCSCAADDVIVGRCCRSRSPTSPQCPARTSAASSSAHSTCRWRLRHINLKLHHQGTTCRWLRIPDDKLELIKSITSILHNASLLYVHPPHTCCHHTCEHAIAVLTTLRTAPSCGAACLVQLMCHVLAYSPLCSGTCCLRYPFHHQLSQLHVLQVPAHGRRAGRASRHRDIH